MKTNSNSTCALGFFRARLNQFGAWARFVFCFWIRDEFGSDLLAPLQLCLDLLKENRRLS